MKTQLTDLREDPFALLAAIERRLQTARVDLAAGSAQYWTGLGFRLPPEFEPSSSRGGRLDTTDDRGKGLIQTSESGTF